MQIHDYRRATFFGSPVEQKTLKSSYKEECDFLLGIKKQKTEEEVKRDRLHTAQCDSLFQKQVMEERRRQIERREMMKKVAEDNMMIAECKRKQQMEETVRDKILMQQAIVDAKVKTPTMVR